MLCKQNRLTKRGSFAFVYRKGERASSPVLSVMCVKGGKCLRVGFSVPNKVGGAVARNLVKRQLRAIVRELLDKTVSAQAVVSAKEGAAALTFSEKKRTVTNLFLKAGLLKK